VGLGRLRVGTVEIRVAVDGRIVRAGGDIIEVGTPRVVVGSGRLTPEVGATRYLVVVVALTLAPTLHLESADTGTSTGTTLSRSSIPFSALERKLRVSLGSANETRLLWTPLSRLKCIAVALLWIYRSWS